MNLAIVRNEKFGNVAVDIYRNGENEMFMTSLQLGEALGYAEPQKGIDKLIERNEYLKDSKFSTTVNLGVVEGGIAKTRTVRVFNEDGIYESSFKSNAKTAFAFRDWVRSILKALRKGETIGVDPAKLEVLKKRVQELTEENNRLTNSIEWNAAKAVSEEEDAMPMFRSSVHKLMKDYAKAFNVEPSKPYGRLYKRFKKETGIDVFKLAECKGYECIMDAIEEIQMIDTLYDVADDEFCCVKDGKEYWKQ